VGVAQNLISPQLRAAFENQVREDYAQARARHAAKQQRSKLLTLEQARANAFRTDWTAYRPVPPRQPGITVFDAIDLAELVPCIDWTPFFQAWEPPTRPPRVCLATT
jgi:5-methyltetrahydrofolate--homocysteine methyltransferase